MSSFESQFGFGVGAVIEYRTFGGGLRRVRVDDVDLDIKNGRPGFSGEMVGAEGDELAGVWGYCDQLVRVVERAPAPMSLSCEIHEAGACPDGCEHAFEERL